MINVLIFIPFIISSEVFVNKYFRYVLFLSGVIFLFIRTGNKLKRKNWYLFLSIFLIILFYSFYYLIAFPGSQFRVIDWLFIVICSFAITVFIATKWDVRYWYSILFFMIVTSTLSIVSFFASNYNLIGYSNAFIGGYEVGFNPILGMVFWTDSYFRPSFYFLEPSYLGFFLGFSFFFILEGQQFIYKNYIVLLILIASLLSGSFTLYFSFLVAISTYIIKKTIFKHCRPENISLMYFTFFIIVFILILVVFNEYKDKVEFDFKTSLWDRKERISNSLNLISSGSTSEWFFGRGPGSNGVIFEKGESNAFVRLFIEEGMIFCMLVFVLIYRALKSRPSLLMFVLISLNSVVMIETPLFVYLLIVTYMVNLKYSNRKAVLQNA